MKNIFILLIAMLMGSPYARPQSFEPAGGRSAGMGYTSILLDDAWGIFNNPGSLHTTTPTFAGSYSLRYFQAAINDVRIGYAMPLGNWQTGAGVAYFGDELFNHIKVSALAGQQVGFARLGLRGNYEQFYIKDYGYRQAFTLDIGGLFTLSPQVMLAMVFHNLTRAGISPASELRLRSFLQAGFSWQPTSHFRLDMQLDKDLELPVQFRASLEYGVSKAITLRTGISPTASEGSLGVGFSGRGFRLDLAGLYSQRLGYSGVISLLLAKPEK